jgi:hypothetical protein
MVPLKPVRLFQRKVLTWKAKHSQTHLHRSLYQVWTNGLLKTDMLPKSKDFNRHYTIGMLSRRGNIKLNTSSQVSDEQKAK